MCLCVHQSQQEKIDSIEDSVNTATANVEEGTKSLGKVCVCVCVCVCEFVYVCVRVHACVWPDDLMCVCVVFGRWEIDGTLPPSHSTAFVPIDPFEYGGKLQLRK